MILSWKTPITGVHPADRPQIKRGRKMEENVTVPETPEVVKHTDAEWYQNVSLEDAEVFIRSNLQSAVRSVIAAGFYLKHIRDNELYLEAGYKNINEYAMDRFGLSASATSRYITRNTRFSRGGDSPLIDDRFKDSSARASYRRCLA